MCLEESWQESGCGRVDYDLISSRYDRHRGGGGPYLDRLVALASETSAKHVLEIGTGTGNNTQAFLDVYPCRLTGLEPSSGMLCQAKAKGIPARWLRASATHVPLADASVEFVFGVYVLHHLKDLDIVFREVARVLAEGFAAFVTAPTDFIERHPMNRYFPSFAKIDKARFQPVAEIRRALEGAGFSSVSVDRFVAPPRPIDGEYVARVAGKFISTYELLPADEFAEGLRRLEADVERAGRLDVDIVWESVTVAGRKEYNGSCLKS